MLETSTSNALIALSVNDVLYQTGIHSTKPQAEQLLICIDDLIHQANISLNELDYIAVSKGPGSFTGLRVAISAAQALAYALNIPIVAICSLQILAQQAYRRHNHHAVTVAIDARMQEVYWARFTLKQQVMVLQSKIEVASPTSMLKQLTQDDILVGNALSIYPELAKAGFESMCMTPKAEDFTYLACLLYAQGQVVSPAALLPEYIRNNVAKKSLKT